MPNIKDSYELINDCYGIYPQGDPDYNVKPTLGKIKDGSSWERHKVFTGGQKDQLNQDFGCLYINKKSKEAVYVSRGSHTSGDWLGTDVNIARGIGAEKRIQDAVLNINMAKSAPDLSDYNFTVVGHSLAGYITQGVCKRTDLKGLSINGPSDEDVETENVLKIDNRDDILVGTIGDKGTNRIIVKTTQPKEMDAEHFFKDPRKWIVDFTSALAKNHQMEDMGKMLFTSGIGDIKFDEALDNTSKERTELIKKVTENTTQDEVSLRLDKQDIQGTSIDRALLSVTEKIVIDDKDGAMDFGVSFRMPLESLGEGLENCVRSVTDFFSGKKENSVKSKDGEILHNFEKSVDNSDPDDDKKKDSKNSLSRVMKINYPAPTHKISDILEANAHFKIPNRRIFNEDGS